MAIPCALMKIKNYTQNQIYIMPVDNIKLSLTSHISEEILNARDIFIYHDLLFIPGYNATGEIYKV